MATIQIDSIMSNLCGNISILVLIFVFIEFLSCKIPNSSQKASSSSIEVTNTNKAKLSDYSIVTDPHGIAFYSKPMDLKSKFEVLSPGTKYEYTSVVKQEPDAYVTWKEIMYEENKGIPNVELTLRKVSD